MDFSGEVDCNIYALSDSQGSNELNQNTTNLWQHLRAKHREAIDQTQHKAAKSKQAHFQHLY